MIGWWYRTTTEFGCYHTPLGTLRLVHVKNDGILVLRPCLDSQARVQLVKESFTDLLASLTRKMLANLHPITTIALNQSHDSLVVLESPFLLALQFI
jgi:hypothetical protein